MFFENLFFSSCKPKGIFLLNKFEVCVLHADGGEQSYGEGKKINEY